MKRIIQKIHNVIKYNKIKCFIMIMLILIMCFQGFKIIYAKFTYNKVSISNANANGFYFSSDYLNEVPGGKYPEYILYGWDGQTKKSFTFKIRNYENPLLYNNDNQSVKYNISYEVPDDVADKVDVKLYQYKDGNYVEADSFTSVLEGGKNTYNVNEYKLSVIPKENKQLTSDLSITINASTIDSPYHRSLSKKLTLQYTQYKNFISTKKFVNPDKDDYNLLYSICTANEVDLSEMENSDIKKATKELHVFWNSDKLSLDRFNHNLASSFETKIIGQDGVTNENMSQYKNVIILDETNKKAHLFFEALPFSEFNLYFYKNYGIESPVWKDGSNYLWETDSDSLVNVELAD